MESTMMTWEEIKRKYPDRWVALTDYKKQGSRIIEAIPVRVCREKEMYMTELELDRQGIDFLWRRTTELEGANIICREEFYIRPICVSGHEKYLNRIQAFLQ